jgi:hypothetical protein
VTPILTFAVLTGLGLALLAGLAGAITLARFLRRKLRIASAVIAVADERTSTFAAELQAHGLPPTAPPVGPAVGRVTADTQVLTLHRPRHAARDRDEALGELTAGGWTRGELQANAVPDRW